jgi:hypothetical protein
MIRDRVLAGQASGVRIGRPTLPAAKVEKVRRALVSGLGIRAAAKATGVSTTSIMRIRKSMVEGSTAAAA